MWEHDAVPYFNVRPYDEAQRALIRTTAATAARDNSCPSCRRVPAAAAEAKPVRAGRTTQEPQPRCDQRAHRPRELSAPLFLAGERPRRLIRERAPFGLKMDGKSEAQMLATVRAYARNASQPLRCHFSSCAVVGSAGSLRGARLGSAIDAHEAVFRVNAAPTAGHEDDVGHRTTWRVHNSEKPWFMASLNTPELQVAVCHTAWIGACQHQAFNGAWSQNATLVNPVFFSQLWTLLGRPRGKKAPSTGLLALALALGACESVSTFGFSTADEPKRTCARHCKRSKRPAVHAPGAAQPPPCLCLRALSRLQAAGALTVQPTATIRPSPPPTTTDWECPRWAEHELYHDPGHPFHDWAAEATIRQQWSDAGLLTDGVAIAAAATAAAQAAVDPHAPQPPSYFEV